MIVNRNKHFEFVMVLAHAKEVDSSNSSLRARYENLSIANHIQKTTTRSALVANKLARAYLSATAWVSPKTKKFKYSSSSLHFELSVFDCRPVLKTHTILFMRLSPAIMTFRLNGLHLTRLKLKRSSHFCRIYYSVIPMKPNTSREHEIDASN